MKYFLIVILLFGIKHAVAQRDTDHLATSYFNAAKAAMENGSLKSADSLYSLSVDAKPFAATYFNRALCRSKLGNQDGYCRDMMEAGLLGDEEALELHFDDCGIKNDIRLDAKKQPTFDSLFVYRLSVHGSKYLGKFTYTLRDSFERIIEQYTVNETKNENETVRDTLWLNLEKKKAVMFVEKMPSFPGGERNLQEFLRQNLRYPQKAREKRINGTVVIQFIVDVDGSIHSLKILRSVNGGCDEEVIRVLRLMPKWTPGTSNGVSVPVYFNLPVTFSL